MASKIASASAGCGHIDSIAHGRLAVDVSQKRRSEDFDAEAGWARFKELLPA
jgi:hypothetical protein